MENPSPAQKRLILVVLSLALLIIVLDTTLLNVSLAAIIRDLHTTVQGFQWVISGYSLTLAALTITGGRLGDFFGRKRMFTLGAVIFAIGSFITSISHSVPEMIIGEAVIEGIGAAMMLPATTSLLISNFKGRERATAFGVWGAMASVGATIGPLVGGYLTTNYSWRWGFRINIGVAALLILGSLIIPESRDNEERPSFDFGGFLLSSLGLVSFVYGIIESSTYGWWRAKEVFSIFGHNYQFGGLSITPIAILIGILLLDLFVVYENYICDKGGVPLVNMKLFKNRQFTSGASLTAAMSLGQTGIIFSVPVFLQSVRGLDALHTGYALLPMSLVLLFASPLGAKLSHTLPSKPLIQVGLLINVVAVFLLRQAVTVDATATSFILPLAVFGLGFGLVISQISNITLSAVSVQEAGEASGVNGTLRQIGAGLGSAIIGAVLLGALATNLSSGIAHSSVIPGNVKTSIAQAASSQSSAVEFGGGGAVGGAKLPAYITDEITHISHQATTDADRLSLVYGFGFAVLGFLISFALPNKPTARGESVAAPQAVLPPAPMAGGRLRSSQELVLALVPAPLPVGPDISLVALQQAYDSHETQLGEAMKIAGTAYYLLSEQLEIVRHRKKHIAQVAGLAAEPLPYIDSLSAEQKPKEIL